MTIETRRIWRNVMVGGAKNLISTAVWWFVVRRNVLLGNASIILIAILWMFWLALLFTACVSTWLDWRDRHAP